MRFLDLNKLKIVTEHNFNTIEINIEANIDNSLKELDQIVKGVLDVLFSRTFAPMETLFRFKLHADVITENEETMQQDIEGFFTVMVNLITAHLFKYLCIDKSRPRERRLDVPQELKRKVRVDLGSLKKVINNATVLDRFNVEIQWSINNEIYGYDMIDQEYENNSDNTIQQEFVHSTDELGKETPDA